MGRGPIAGYRYNLVKEPTVLTEYWLALSEWARTFQDTTVCTIPCCFTCPSHFCYMWAPQGHVWGLSDLW